jgi:hypothetical protein
MKTPSAFDDSKAVSSINTSPQFITDGTMLKEIIAPTLEGQISIECDLESAAKFCSILADSGYTVEIRKMQDGGSGTFNKHPVFQIKYELMGL